MLRDRECSRDGLLLALFCPCAPPQILSLLLFTAVFSSCDCSPSIMASRKRPPGQSEPSDSAVVDKNPKSSKVAAASSPGTGAVHRDVQPTESNGQKKPPPRALLSWAQFELQKLLPEGLALRDCGGAGDCFYLCLVAALFGHDVVATPSSRGPYVSFVRHLIADALDSSAVMTQMAMRSRLSPEDCPPSVNELKVNQLIDHNATHPDDQVSAWSAYLRLVRDTNAYATQLEILAASVLFNITVRVDALFNEAETTTMQCAQFSDQLPQMHTMVRLQLMNQPLHGVAEDFPANIPVLRVVTAGLHYKLVVRGATGRIHFAPSSAADQQGTGGASLRRASCDAAPVRQSVATMEPSLPPPATPSSVAMGLEALRILAISTLEPKDILNYQKAVQPTAALDHSNSSAVLQWFVEFITPAPAPPRARSALLTLATFDAFYRQLQGLQSEIEQEVFPKEQQAKKTSKTSKAAKFTIKTVCKHLHDHGVSFAKTETDEQLRAKLTTVIQESKAEDDWRRHKLQHSMERLTEVRTVVDNTKALRVGLVGRMGQGKTFVARCLAQLAADPKQPSRVIAAPTPSIQDADCFPFDSKIGNFSVTKLPVCYRYAPQSHSRPPLHTHGARAGDQNSATRRLACRPEAQHHFDSRGCSRWCG